MNPIVLEQPPTGGQPTAPSEPGLVETLRQEAITSFKAFFGVAFAVVALMSAIASLRDRGSDSNS